MEVRWLLRVGVLDIQHGVANRGAKAATPGVIEERNKSQRRQGHPFDRGDRIREIVLDADVHRSIVHVVLDSIAIDNLEPPGVFLAELDVGSQVQTPTKSIAAEVTDRGFIQVYPTDLSEDACQLHVTPMPD